MHTWSNTNPYFLSIKNIYIHKVFALCFIYQKLTFHNPSLANITNSASSLIFSTVTYGSELKCFFKLLSPNALDTANRPSTRGTSPE